MPPLIAAEGFVLVSLPREIVLLSLGPMPPLIAVEGFVLVSLPRDNCIAQFGSNAAPNRR